MLFFISMSMVVILVGMSTSWRAFLRMSVSAPATGNCGYAGTGCSVVCPVFCWLTRAFRPCPGLCVRICVGNGPDAVAGSILTFF